MAILSQHIENSWLVAAGALAMAILLAAANILKINASDPDPGQTTEVAALVMYATGAYLVLGSMVSYNFV